MNDTKFETWLGSIVNPHEKFYLVAENEEVLDQLINRIAKLVMKSKSHLHSF